jgi:hypothetical protein
MKPILPFIAIFTMLLLSSAASAGERAKADVDCKATREKLVYDCMIMLMNKNSGDPIPGAKIVVKPDMPSMPMAHNVTPINAMAMGKPGSYHARLKLEMQGEWALTIDVSGPLRDRLVKKLQFGAMSAMKHGEGEMKHEHGMKHDEAKPESE